MNGTVKTAANNLHAVATGSKKRKRGLAPRKKASTQQPVVVEAANVCPTEDRKIVDCEEQNGYSGGEDAAPHALETKASGRICSMCFMEQSEAGAILDLRTNIVMKQTLNSYWKVPAENVDGKLASICVQCVYKINAHKDLTRTLKIRLQRLSNGQLRNALPYYTEMTTNPHIPVNKLEQQESILPKTSPRPHASPIRNLNGAKTRTVGSMLLTPEPLRAEEQSEMTVCCLPNPIAICSPDIEEKTIKPFRNAAEALITAAPTTENNTQNYIADTTRKRKRKRLKQSAQEEAEIADNNMSGTAVDVANITSPAALIQKEPVTHQLTCKCCSKVYYRKDHFSKHIRRCHAIARYEAATKSAKTAEPPPAAALQENIPFTTLPATRSSVDFLTPPSQRNDVEEDLNISPLMLIACAAEAAPPSIPRAPSPRLDESNAHNTPPPTPDSETPPVLPEILTEEFSKASLEAPVEMRVVEVSMEVPAKKPGKESMEVSTTDSAGEASVAEPVEANATEPVEASVTESVEAPFTQSVEPPARVSLEAPITVPSSSPLQDNVSPAGSSKSLNHNHSMLEIICERSESALCTESGGKVQGQTLRMICQRCSKVYWRKDYYTRHVKRCHARFRIAATKSLVALNISRETDANSPAVGRRTVRARVFHCSECSVTLENITKLRQHKRIHMHHLYCETCGKECTTKYDYDFHSIVCKAQNEALNSETETPHAARTTRAVSTRMTRARSRAESRAVTCASSRYAVSCVFRKYNTRKSYKEPSSELSDDDEDDAVSIADTMYTKRMRFTGDWVEQQVINDDLDDQQIRSYREYELYLLDRLKDEVDSNLYSCFAPNCHFQADRLVEVMIHDFVDHFKGAYFYCKKCGRVFTSKVFLDYHLDRQNNGRFMCFKCGDIFEFQNDLDRHLLRHTKSVNYRCNYCKFEFLTEAELLQHCEHEQHEPNEERNLVRIDPSMTIVNDAPPPEVNRRTTYMLTLLDMQTRPMISKRPDELPYRRLVGDVEFKDQKFPNCWGWK